MTPYDQCFTALGIECPTIEQKRALRRLVEQLTPEAKVLRRARLAASEAGKRSREDGARVEVLRGAIERVLNMGHCSAGSRRILEDATGATTYDGRSARAIKMTAE